METKIIKGVVLSSFDYKEKDRLVELFTAELGKITAVIKGCKAPSAKLKFAFQPFCFAEFSVIQIGKFYQIIDATLIDSFFDLTKQLDTYYLSSLVLELTSISIEDEEQNANLFILLLNVLKNICYDKLSPYLVTLKFCIDIMSMLGYKISFSKCSSCGLSFTNKIFLNLDVGSFVCVACKTQNSIIISNQAFASIKIVSNTDYQRLNTVKIANNVSREAIIVLCKNLEQRLSKIIRSSKFI